MNVVNYLHNEVPIGISAQAVNKGKHSDKNLFPLFRYDQGECVKHNAEIGIKECGIKN